MRFVETETSFDQNWFGIPELIECIKLPNPKPASVITSLGLLLLLLLLSLLSQQGP